MNIKHQIKSIVKESGFTLTEVVEKLNETFYQDQPTTLQNLSNKLNRGSLRYDEAQQIAHVIGKKILWIDL